MSSFAWSLPSGKLRYLKFFRTSCAGLIRRNIATSVSVLNRYVPVPFQSASFRRRDCVSPPKTSRTYSLYFYLRIVQFRVIIDCVSGFAAVYKFSADADLCGEFICKLFNLLKKGA